MNSWLSGITHWGLGPTETMVAGNRRKASEWPLIENRRTVPSGGRVRSTELVVDGTPVSSLLLAERFGQRLRGMLARKPLPPAMLISPCSSVHTWWMSATIDVALLNSDRQVIAVRTMKPWGFFGARGTTTVLEAPAGSFERWGLDVSSAISWTANGHQ